jgi:hypothetical protein
LERRIPTQALELTHKRKEVKKLNSQLDEWATLIHAYQENEEQYLLAAHLDEQGEKLLALALDPAATENEARNAAIQVCKRLKK